MKIASQWKSMLLLSVAVSFLLLSGAAVYCQDGSRFTWTQLRYEGPWDPYPEAWTEIEAYLKDTTSVPLQGKRRSSTLSDVVLFESPFLALTGKDAPADMTDAETQALRRYLGSGGFLWIEDASGLKAGPFDRWVRRTMTRVLPDSRFEVLTSTHAVFRSFYLLRSVGGRVQVQPSLEGIQMQNRTVVLYTRNDLQGAWVKDSLGNYLYPCVPGGENQRREAQKLTVNIVFYVLTGTYKLDAVHQPFILEKLRSYAQ